MYDFLAMQVWSLPCKVTDYCLPFCLHLLDALFSVKSHCSNFRIIKAIFSVVQFFSVFIVFMEAEGKCSKSLTFHSYLGQCFSSAGRVLGNTFIVPVKIHGHFLDNQGGRIFFIFWHNIDSLGQLFAIPVRLYQSQIMGVSNGRCYILAINKCQSPFFCANASN